MTSSLIQSNIILTTWILLIFSRISRSIEFFAFLRAFIYRFLMFMKKKNPEKINIDKWIVTLKKEKERKNFFFSNDNFTLFLIRNFVTYNENLEILLIKSFIQLHLMAWKKIWIKERERKKDFFFLFVNASILKLLLFPYTTYIYL